MPNKNNYIAFNLDHQTINDFYKISQELSQKINNFVPFELEQIHLTVCFLGELGKKIKTNKKETFEKLLNLKNIVQKHILLLMKTIIYHTLL